MIAIFIIKLLAKLQISMKVLELTKKKMKSFKKKTRDSRRRRRSKFNRNFLNVTIEEHLKCACLCEKTQQDCNLKVHHYDPDQCTCTCKEA